MIEIVELLDCIGVHSCTELEFTIPKENVLLQNSSNQTILLPFKLLANLQVGSTITINNIVFTITDVAGTANDNNILYGNVPESFIDRIIEAINTSYAFKDCLAEKILDNGDFPITISCPCNQQIEVSLLNEELDIDYSDVSTGRELELTECHTVKVRLINKDAECPPEIQVPVLVKLDCKGCEIDSIEAKKDISKYLQTFVKTPTPDCSKAAVLHKAGIGKLNIEFAESIGTDTIGGSIYSKDVWLFNSIQKDMSEYCNGGATLNNYPNRTKICRSACMKTYIPLTVDGSHAITGEYDAGGGKVITVDYGTFTDCGLLELDTSPTQFGLDCDTDSYRLTIIDNVTLEGGGLLQYTYQTATFTIVDIDYSNQFLYLNSNGAFNTFCSEKVINETTNDINEYIKLCAPCDETDVVGTSIAISAGTFKQFTINIDTCKCPQAEEFLCATEIYWCLDEKLYKITKVSNSYTNFANGKDQVVPFTFQLESFKKVLQC